MGNSAGVGALGQALQGFSSTYFPAKENQKQRAIQETMRQATQRADTQRIVNRGGSSTGVEDVSGVPNAGEFGAMASKRKGGRIKKTGPYLLHKGEVVIPERIAKRIGKRKASRTSGRR